VTQLNARAARRRYLALVALRWLPTGLLIPILVLLMVARGLSLTEIGLAWSAQGLVVLALELPTGGLSDTIGRKPVLLLATLVAVLSYTVLFVADSLPMFVLATGLQGVFRALDSGPLEAWYVDATLAAEPDARLEVGLGAGSFVLGIAIALGALLSGVLVGLHPLPSLEPLALPILVAIGLQLLNLAAIAALMTEPRAGHATRGLAHSVGSVSAVVREGLAMLRSSRVLLGLVAVEGLWGFSMITFESLFPVRLSEVLGTTDAAGALMGPIGSAAWVVSAAGAAGIALVSGRVGVARSAAVLRILQGLTIVGMGLLGGVVGVVTAYLACYLVHGASNPLHTTLLHREVDGSHRTTVLSMNSMVGQPAGALGGILLGAIADGASVPTAMLIGALVCAVAAPLYLPAWRAERDRNGGQPGTARRVAEVSDSPA
jgi:MFS family permease